MRVYLTRDRSKLHHRLEVKMRVAILYLKIWCLKVYLNLNQTFVSVEYCFLFCRPFFNLHNVLFCWFYCITLSSIRRQRIVTQLSELLNSLLEIFFGWNTGASNVVKIQKIQKEMKRLLFTQISDSIVTLNEMNNDNFEFIDKC